MINRLISQHDKTDIVQAIFFLYTSFTGSPCSTGTNLYHKIPSQQYFYKPKIKVYFTGKCCLQTVMDPERGIAEFMYSFKERHRHERCAAVCPSKNLELVLFATQRACLPLSFKGPKF